MEYLTFDDVGLIPCFTDIGSRSHVSIETKVHNTIYSYPFVPANMDTVVSREMCEVLKNNNCMIIYHRFATLEERIAITRDYPTAYMSCGVTEQEKDVIYTLVKQGCKNFCIDVAHGHSKLVSETIIFIRSRCKEASIIAGNVCTADGYKYLAYSGANIIKVGVGPGSVCTTRMKTGFGVPQFSAIQECVKAKNELSIPTWLIADGGIKHPRDACIGLALGADMVMMGKLFAQTRESAGEKVVKVGNEYIPIQSTRDLHASVYTHYRGQASRHFMDDFYGSKKKNIVAEGEDFYTECKGSTHDVLQEYGGSLRSALTYGGAKTLEVFRKNARFFRSTSSYMLESGVRK